MAEVNLRSWSEISQASEGLQLTSTAATWENILARLARIESRLLEHERRAASTLPPLRPEPDPPDGPLLYAAAQPQFQITCYQPPPTYHQPASLYNQSAIENHDTFQSRYAASCHITTFNQHQHQSPNFGAQPQPDYQLQYAQPRYSADGYHPWSPEYQPSRLYSCLDSYAQPRDLHIDYHKLQHEYQPSQPIPSPPLPSHCRSAALLPTIAPPPPLPVTAPSVASNSYHEQPGWPVAAVVPQEPGTYTDSDVLLQKSYAENHPWLHKYQPTQLPSQSPLPRSDSFAGFRSLEKVCAEEVEVRPGHLEFSWDCDGHTSVPIELIDSMEAEQRGEGNDNIRGTTDFHGSLATAIIYRSASDVGVHKVRIVIDAITEGAYDSSKHSPWDIVLDPIGWSSSGRWSKTSSSLVISDLHELKESLVMESKELVVKEVDSGMGTNESDNKWNLGDSLEVVVAVSGVVVVEESKSQDGHAFNIKKPKFPKPDDRILLSLLLKVGEIYLPKLYAPQFADLVALSYIKSKCVSDLDNLNSPFTLAIVTHRDSSNRQPKKQGVNYLQPTLSRGGSFSRKDVNGVPSTWDPGPLVDSSCSLSIVENDLDGEAAVTDPIPREHYEKFGHPKGRDGRKWFHMGIAHREFLPIIDDCSVTNFPTNVDMGVVKRLIRFGVEEYKRTARSYTFDPGGDTSKLLLSSTLFVASWFTP